MKVKLTAMALAVGVLVLAGCSSGDTSASKTARDRSNQLQSQVYQSKHEVEFNNYNDRQRIADDPSTIVWCTFFPQTPAQEPLTVPIAGKLTSSNKRPYRSTFYNGDGYAFENPGPDHMFGSSSEYRYGFDPTRTIYYDFTDLPSICTTAPLVWQKNKTTIVVETDETLGSIDRAAQQALKAGDAAKALAILKKGDSNGK